VRERSRNGSFATSESSSDKSETLRPRRFIKCSAEAANEGAPAAVPLLDDDGAAAWGKGGGGMLEDAVAPNDVFLVPLSEGRPNMGASFSTAGVVAGCATTETASAAGMSASPFETLSSPMTGPPFACSRLLGASPALSPGRMGVEPHGSVAGAAGGGAGATAGFDAPKVKPLVVEAAPRERVLAPSSALGLSSPTTGPPLSALREVGAAPSSLSPGRAGVVPHGRAVDEAAGGKVVVEGLVDSGGGLAAEPNENGEDAAGAVDAGAVGEELGVLLPNEKSDDGATGFGAAGGVAADPKVNGEDGGLLAPPASDVVGGAIGVAPNENGVAAAGLGAPGTGIELKGLEGTAPKGLADGLLTALASPDVDAAAALLVGVEPKVKLLLAIPPKGFAGGAPKEATPKFAIAGGGVFEARRTSKAEVEATSRRERVSGVALERTELATPGDARPGLAVLRCGRPRILHGQMNVVSVDGLSPSSAH